MRPIFSEAKILSRHGNISERSMAIYVRESSQGLRMSSSL
jgi:hypothetical protein